MAEESQQAEAFQESLARGQAFEELIRTKGWKYVQQWYQTKIQRFATSLLIEDTKDITEFEAERRELIGLRKTLGMIENDLKTLHDQQEKEKKEKQNAQKNT